MSSRVLQLARLGAHVLAQQQITSRELLRMQLLSNNAISTRSVLRNALQQHSSLAVQSTAAAAAGRFSPLSVGRQRMQQLVQQHQAQIDAVWSKSCAWSLSEASPPLCPTSGVHHF